MKRKKTVTEKQEIRRAVADLLGAAGCSCCRDDKGWDAAHERLGKLLRVPKYPDGSGYDFTKFRTPGGTDAR